MKENFCGWLIWFAIGMLVMLVLTGCSGWGPIKSGIAYHGAKVADEELIAAAWAYCEAPTAGALRRKFANDPDGLKAWQECCRRNTVQPVAP